MICYRDLLKSFENNPRDIITRPTIRREGKWFHVYTENGHVIVTGASVVEIFTDLTVWMGIRKVIDRINANAVA